MREPNEWMTDVRLCVFEILIVKFHKCRPLFVCFVAVSVSLDRVSWFVKFSGPIHHRGLLHAFPVNDKHFEKFSSWQSVII